MQRVEILAAAIALILTAPVGAQDQQFRAGVEIVEVDVIAVDRDGHTVPDLRQSDFEIREDGREMDIATFVAAFGRSGGGRIGHRR